MKKTLLLPGLALALALNVSADVSNQKNWAQWRGPLATGEAPQAEPPLKWSETENVKWKVKIPGFGTSTPIVWGDKLFILTAMKKAEAEAPAAAPREAAGQGGRRGEKPSDVYQFIVMCLDRGTGKTLWQKVAREEVPHEGHHQDHGFASASPVTDGKHLIAFFGSRGLYCYDLDGNLKWEKDLGNMRTRNGFGEGASPALHGSSVFVVWDHEDDDDFIVALDKETGNERWRVARNEPTSWSTPLVVEHEGVKQVVVNATGKVRSYDFDTGKVLWECGGQTVNAIPSPVTQGGTVYVTSGFRGSALHAIQLGKSGDLSGTDAVLWTRNKNTPYVPSPLLVDDCLYTVTGNNGVLSCFNTKDGAPRFEGERLGAFGIYASPVAAKDRVYVLNRDGACLVLKKGGAAPEVLATNKLEDRTDASIALVDKEIFIRGHQHLYCIAEK